MRAITKPSFPNISDNLCLNYCQVLGASVGFYCAVCEKALRMGYRAFHKQKGLLSFDQKMSPEDWPDILLICHDCSACAPAPVSEDSYFWPDTGQAQAGMSYLESTLFTYQVIEGTSQDTQSSSNLAGSSNPQDLILVRASDLAKGQADLNRAINNTIALFKLNGHYFNDDYVKPAISVPYSEYLMPTDLRLQLRYEAWMKGVQSGKTLALMLPLYDLDPRRKRYVIQWLNFIKGTIDYCGFVSTWSTAIVSTLETINPILKTKFYQILDNIYDQSTSSSSSMDVEQRSKRKVDTCSWDLVSDLNDDLRAKRQRTAPVS